MFKTPTLILITGPTGIGKTSCAIKLAKHFNTEIVSTDSRQFYKEMKIGTAVPSDQELATVKHHFIQHLSIHKNYSAGEFERDTNLLLNQLFKQNKVVLAVGGSGLYTKAIVEGLDDMPPADLSLRNQLTLLYEKGGLSALQKKLKDLNSHKLSQMDASNPQRLMRAIEIELQHIDLSSTQKTKKNYQTILLGLNTSRELLYHQINQRVDKMMEQGLLNEVKSLLEFKHLNALQTVGYTELFSYLAGEISLEFAVNKIKQHSRNYAKKQITWFKKMPGIAWFEPNNTCEMIKHVENYPNLKSDLL